FMHHDHYICIQLCDNNTELHSFPTRRSSDLRIGKISPIYAYKFKTFTITLVNIIKDSMNFKITDKNNRSVRVTIYNLKNLFTTKDRKSTRLNSSHVKISYAVFCLKKKKITKK